MIVSDYEMRVLRHLQKRRGLPLGNKMVALAAAARRLEKKGLVYQSGGWGITNSGNAFVQKATVAHPGMWSVK